MDGVKQADGFPWRPFLMLYLPAAALILAGAWYLAQARIEAEHGLILAREHMVAALGAGQLSSRLSTPIGHLRAITSEPAVQDAIEGGSAEARAALAHAFSTLVMRNAQYAQVRWLDEAGLEQVRVDNLAGSPLMVAPGSLQDKRDRYYFSEAMRLAPGDIYVSPLDLNIEHGRVEVPYRPMLRIATPVRDRQARARGILIINLAAQGYLDAIFSGHAGSHDHLQLLNQDGYWLKSPNPADEWGFMFRREITLGSRNPAAWRAIASSPSGQRMLPDGLWTWERIHPLAPQDMARSSAPYLLLVSHLSAAELAGLATASWRPVSGYTLVLLILSGLLLARLVQVQARHKQAELAATAMQAKAEALQLQAEAQQRFRHVVEASTHGILVADSRGRIVMANPALAAMFGIPGDVLVGRQVESLLPAQLRKSHVNHRKAYALHPRDRAMGVGYDLLAERADGTQFPVEVGLSSYASAGETYYLATVVDITERNQLAEMSRRFAAIIDTTEDAIISMTLDGVITSWNHGAEKLFGYREDEAIGQSVGLILPPGYEREESELLQRVALGEGIAQYNTVRRCRDGRLVDISNTISPLYDAKGRIIGASKIARDISAIKAAEADIRRLNEALERRVQELDRANQELDSFAYAVSHDLRAPLRAMNGFSHALREDYGDRLDATGRAYLAEIDSASRRMGALIEGILLLSRSTRGQLQCAPIDISAVAARLRDELAKPEPERQVEWDIAPGLEAWGDPRLIEDVLRNLLANAWKYSAAARPARIRVYAEEQNGAQWICVADNGAGFDMCHADKLGQPFQRLHRQDEYAGLGIGLATVRRILDRHHGRLRAHAVPGLGAVFAFSLPDCRDARQEVA